MTIQTHSSMRPRRRVAGRKTKQEVVETFRTESIEDAAIAVIARKGLAATTIQDVADAAGIAKGTVYLYFRDRDHLVAKAAARAYETLVGDFDATFSPSGTLEERLTRIVLHPLEFVEKHSELLVAALALADQETRPHSRSRLDSMFQARLEQVFADARSRGEVRDLDCSSIAAILIGCIRGLILRRLGKASQQACEEDANLIVSVLLHGIQITACRPPSQH